MANLYYEEKAMQEAARIQFENQHRGHKLKGQVIDFYEDGKIVKKINTPGDGVLVPGGSKVYVHYCGKLEDGTVFDQSREGHPFSFSLGAGQVILGWDLGVGSMQRGEKCTLTLDPDFAYGEQGAGETIPPNSKLIFDIELVSYEEPPEQPMFHWSQLVMLLMIMVIFYYIVFVQQPRIQQQGGSQPTMPSSSSLNPAADDEL